MQPLEGFYYFTQVVEHGGFAKAGRALGLPKSRLSRHVAALEAELGVRLINRSTRRFVVTEVGQQVYRHARAMLAEADAAVAAVEFARAEPRGALRVSCPVALAQSAFAQMLPEFLRRYPQVRMQLSVSNRRVDVLHEGFDVALRVRSHPSGEDGLVMRSFQQLDEYVVASPAYLAASSSPQHPAELATHAILDSVGDFERATWELVNPAGEVTRVDFTARMVCHDFIVLRAATLAGLGISRLPESMVRAELKQGSLVRVLPGWNSPQGILHVVFPSRRGMLPAVRAFIDFLAQRLPGVL